MESNFTYTGELNGPAIAAVLSLMTLAALIANVTVLSITLYQRKSWKQSSTIFFTSLILAHLVMALLCMPFYIISYAVDEWIFGSTDEEKRGTCYFTVFIFWYTVLVISMTLAAISFDRFLFIVKPHLHKQFMRPRVALTLTIAIWLIAALLSSTPFYGLGEFVYTDWFGSCLPVFTNYTYGAYAVVLAVSVLLVVVITSIWTFCFTYKFLRDQSVIAGEESVYASKKKRLFGIFGAMLLVYCICLMPAFIGVVIAPLDLVNGYYVAVAGIFIHLFTVLNPVLQSYFRPGFKEIIAAVIMKWPRRKMTNIMTRMSLRLANLPQ